MSDQHICNTCNIPTNHTVVHAEVYDETEMLNDDYWIKRECTYAIIKCAGCNSVSFIKKEIGDDTNGNYLTTYYPGRTVRKRPIWISRLIFDSLFYNNPKYAFLNEIYKALDGNNLRLAVLGIRSLIEHVMIDKTGDHGSFSRNLEEFKKAGHISEVQVSTMRNVVELGHAVTHRAHIPNVEQVEAALDATENVISAIYVDPFEIQQQLRNIPKRNTSNIKG